MFDKYSLWSDTMQLRGANFNLRMRVHGLDPDSSNPFFPDYNSDSFVQLRTAGANVIFLSIPISFMVEPPYKIEADHFSILEDLVNRAEAADLLVVLAFRTSSNRPSQDILDALPITLEPPQEHATDQLQTGFIQMWQLVADKFKGRSSIVGYDLLIEPPSQRNTTENRDKLGLSWQDLCQRTIAAIREIDADTPILVQPRAWTSPETLQAWQQIGLFRSPI